MIRANITERRKIEREIKVFCNCLAEAIKILIAMPISTESKLIRFSLFFIKRLEKNMCEYQ